MIRWLVIVLSVFVLAGCQKEHPTQKLPDPAPLVSSKRLAPEARVQGQLVYTPIYSSVYDRSHSNLVHLTATLSIHNISPKKSIIVDLVDYYDTNGKFIRSFVDQPFQLGPLETRDFVIPALDLQGGTGANCLVEWEAPYPVAVPIIESVMISADNQQGISFVSRGKEIEPH